MIITAITISTENASRAEFGIDWLRQLSGGKPKGYALLVFDGVHEEYIQRVKLSADLAFEGFDILVPASKDSPQKMASAVVRRNNLFLSAAEYCQRVFRCPFIFLEPESVPTNPQWMENLENIWESQPRRYVLTHLRDSAESPRFHHAVGIYHMGFWGDVAKLCADPSNLEKPWERISGEHTVSKSTKTRAFYPLKISTEEDISKVWPEAQIVTSDPSGAFTEHLREKGVHLSNPFPYLIPVENLDTENYREARLTPILGSGHGPLQKIDLRTKAGRALKAQNGNGHT